MGEWGWMGGGGWVCGWVVGDCKNKANSAQLGLAGAWAELGNIHTLRDKFDLGNF